MGSLMVVVFAPCRNQMASMVQAGEEVLVQALVPEPSIDGEDGPAPEKGPYDGPTLQEELSHDPNYVVGLDLAKNVFHVHVADASGSHTH